MCQRQGVCVRVPSEQTENFARGSSNYIKILIYILFYFIIPIYTLKQGVTGVPVGSVTNEDTSPGPVKTYLRDCGDAPGRI